MDENEALARKMRRKPTPAESLLWQRLRDRQVGDAKFRQQHGIGPYVADFYCAEVKLVVEVDGDIHDLPDTRAKDEERDANLAASGFRTLRFRNEAVLGNVEAVIVEIATALASTRTQ